MINGYSPFDYEVQEDPYPAYAWLRESAPVYRNDHADFWALSRHADVAAAWPDSERFSSANGVHLEPTSWGPDAWRFYSFLAMDRRGTRGSAAWWQGVSPAGGSPTWSSSSVISPGVPR
jgi:cytochrome P450